MQIRCKVERASERSFNSLVTSIEDVERLFWKTELVIKNSVSIEPCWQHLWLLRENTSVSHKQLDLKIFLYRKRFAVGIPKGQEKEGLGTLWNIALSAVVQTIQKSDCIHIHQTALNCCFLSWPCVYTCDILQHYPYDLYRFEVFAHLIIYCSTPLLYSCLWENLTVSMVAETERDCDAKSLFDLSKMSRRMSPPSPAMVTSRWIGCRLMLCSALTLPRPCCWAPRMKSK